MMDARRIAEIKAITEKATPGPWAIESCGEKGDGSNMIGVIFDPEDINCERPISGWAPQCRPLTGEFIEYYVDETVAECEHRNRNAGHDAAFIALARAAIPQLLDALEAAQAELKSSVDEGQAYAMRAEAALEAQAQEIERLTRWIADLQSGMYINCVYCGHRYGPDPETPVAMAEVLKAHIAECPFHPLSHANIEIHRLRNALLNVIGCDHHAQTPESRATKIARAALAPTAETEKRRK